MTPSPAGRPASTRGRPARQVPRGHGGGGHEPHLPQLGVVILTMPDLHEPFRGEGVEPIGGGAIESHPRERGIQVPIDAQRLLPEFRLYGAPHRRVPQTAQHDREPVVGKLGWPQCLTQDAREHLLMAPGSFLHMGFAVVAFREDVGQPPANQPAVRKTLMQRMVARVAVEERGQAQVAHETQQERHVIEPFVFEVQYFAHRAALLGDIPRSASSLPRTVS